MIFYHATSLHIYRRHHSTETFMLRVLSDVLTAAAAQQVTLLGHLDLSAAFDCVDHQLLLQRLRRDFIYTETELAWTTSFVTGRTRQGLSSSCSAYPVYEQVPQDLSLAPYCLSCILQKSAESLLSTGSKFYQYADDCQIYVATSVSVVHIAIDQLSRCLHDVDV